jgi:hypothetical protein
MLLSRRGLLQAGLLGSTAAWAGGLLGCVARRDSPSPGATQRAALSPPAEEILRAVIPVVLGPLLPATDPAREQALDAGLASLDDYLAHLSLPLQQEARNVFDMLDLLPLRVLLLGTRQRWHEAPPEAIEAFLRSARDSRFSLLRRIYVFLQSMAVLAWFDQPSAWHEIGYPGPPLGPYAGSGRHA